MAGRLASVPGRHEYLRKNEDFYQFSATDPLTFALVSLLLAGVAMLACYILARLTAKVDQVVALRCG